MSSTELRVKELLRERGWTTKVLAEKTGMSESYLTHIKNGTRRWNEDALRKLAQAFEIHPIDLFAHRKSRTDNVESKVALPQKGSAEFVLKIVPVVGELPTSPSPYNNQQLQLTSGYKDVFVPFFESKDPSMFCLAVENNLMAPTFTKGDYLIISPEGWVRSGDMAAVEYGSGTIHRTIMQVTFIDDFIVLESVNHKSHPVALIRGKDYFRIIGKLLYRYQKLG